MAFLNSNLLLFGIVCFRERFWECSSFLDLYHSYLQSKSSERLKIFVFDNTDLDDWFTEFPDFGENITIIYNRNKLNPGISFAYNRIADYAKNHDYKNIVFFDQDSSLPLNSYSIYHVFSTKGIHVAAPKVISGNNLISPSKYINYRSVLYDKISSESIPINGNSCINSGLMIKTELFFTNGSYNEDLRLDFCDHDFIQRLSLKTTDLFILPYNLHQDFSTDTNTLEQALFRYQLFEKDLSTFKKNRNKMVLELFVGIPHVLRLTVQYITFAFLKMKYF